MALTGTARKAITAAGIAAPVGIGFAAGYTTAPDRTSTGYRMGNEDGYSIGYRDGQAGNQPSPHGFMTDEDQQLRSETGGRNKGR